MCRYCHFDSVRVHNKSMNKWFMLLLKLFILFNFSFGSDFFFGFHSIHCFNIVTLNGRQCANEICNRKYVMNNPLGSLQNSQECVCVCAYCVCVVIGPISPLHRKKLPFVYSKWTLNNETWIKSVSFGIGGEMNGHHSSPSRCNHEINKFYRFNPIFFANFSILLIFGEKKKVKIFFVVFRCCWKRNMWMCHFRGYFSPCRHQNLALISICIHMPTCVCIFNQLNENISTVVCFRCILWFTASRLCICTRFRRL